ncbi:unnamed protein product [Notodromas monacha]|uniref:Uncharacterized protein n=1 Tax=Notodromas monacha TaxID=399045 RepID=A0A7R9BXA4_9CRUS|nr:unnamed protein product [Notodromas monacha]CAG0922317.1 unnamed protein product [Notodromas monacha]
MDLLASGLPEKESVDYEPSGMILSPYGGGTRPWNNACGKQQTDDGRMEVIGLTTYQLFEHLENRRFNSPPTRVEARGFAPTGSLSACAPVTPADGARLDTGREG